ncbi:MAG: hypothetical protein LV481_06715 [Methylacidiphilales bacterium]|nr:hypothetical protein [Candidatus Methylacidiphilales bacterium]
MKATRIPLLLLLAWLTGGTAGFAQSPDALLPAGVKAVWTLDQAFRESTATQERVCLNGLWRWQPGTDAKEGVPSGNWGYFKVPGCWPGITDYMQMDSQTVYFHPAWQNQDLRDLTTAWYQREITVPAEWTGRRITLYAEYLNSFAIAYIDGQEAGEIQFPAGEVDLTAACQPGSRHVLSLFVAALPLKDVVFSHANTSTLKEVKGSVARRGLCGDVYLVGTPPANRIDGVKVATSVRKGEISLDVTLRQLDADGKYSLRATISDDTGKVEEFTSDPFSGHDVTDDHFAWSKKWMPEKLWDIKSPQNIYSLSLSLLDANGKALDTALPVRFGYREFWIDGRDFYLNGTRLHLSCVPLDNAEVSASTATYDAAKESFLRLQSFGINCVYAHNYDCAPGSHLSFSEILRAADDTGMLVSLSQPHFSDYDWKAPDADASNGYARHAAFYVQVAGNHPSVVFYSMSHNATGYNEDMNPDLIDGISDPRDNWAQKNVKLALRAQAIVNRLDPSRIVYHHASGNLGSMHDSNFYPNFAPMQELDDWFEHWATVGVKPVFTCEYGAPYTWDWTLYRGWYKGKRAFGEAQVQWEFCFAEWASQFLGDRAFQISEMEKANLRWEAAKFRAGATWFRWDYPYEVGSNKFEDRQTVTAMYLTDNWRAYRTWGLSANSPSEYAFYWRLRDGVDKKRVDLKVDWDNLQRPGYSPDYLDKQFERMDMAYGRDDWVPTSAGQALLRNNMPLLAYIGGKPAAFTSKDHNFVPGETVEKQLIVINNSRDPVDCDCAWSLNLPQPVTGEKKVTVAPGDQARVPLSLALPTGLQSGPKGGSYELEAKFTFSTGETQSDSFPIDVLPPAPPAGDVGIIALFDPAGETAKLLDRLGINYQTVTATADLSAYDMLIIGKAALTVDGPGPDVSRVRDGLKVIMFEQTSDVLEKRFGFRAEEYGLRQVFSRVPGYPALAGLTDDNLRDWRGEATILPSRLKYELNPHFYGAPTVKWCNIDVTRVWRCGNRGNVASVLIEKPAHGDFLPILDGGFSLQYSPLLEYHEGQGMVIFCQADVTGRTETDPAADLLARNIVVYASAWKPKFLVRQALYVGDPAGKSYFQQEGIPVADYTGERLEGNQVLIVGPGGGLALAANKEAIGDSLHWGGPGHILAIGLSQDESDAFLPFDIRMTKAEHIATTFAPFGTGTPFTGIGPADVYNRDPHEFSLVTGNVDVSVGDGILAAGQRDQIVFCQLVPWQFDYAKQYDLKRTYRRTAFLVTRLLANMGVAEPTAILNRFSSPVDPAKPETRWLDGLYADTPEEMDDPYRFFRW